MSLECYLQASERLCYAVRPSTFDQVYAGSHPSIVLVQSPLTLTFKGGVSPRSRSARILTFLDPENKSLVLTSPDYFSVAQATLGYFVLNNAHDPLTVNFAS